MQGKASEQLTELQGQAKSMIPDITVSSFLKKAFQLTQEQLDALLESNSIVLTEAFWDSLNKEKWALLTSAAGFIPFIGQDFLAAKSMWRESREVLKHTAEKITSNLPKTSEPQQALRGGGNSNAILRRIEKSKRQFYTTNTRVKTKKYRRRV